jgi:hypothetical protein
MDAPLDPAEEEAEILRAFVMACRVERDRRSLAELAAADRRFETAAVDRETAEQLANGLIASLATRNE